LRHLEFVKLIRAWPHIKRRCASEAIAKKTHGSVQEMWTELRGNAVLHR
jgi:hypothetical protein